MRKLLRFTVGLVVAMVATAGEARAQTDAPGSSRLFLAPTGRMLAPGEGYVGGYGLLVPTVQVGVTKRFSLGAGAMPVNIFAGQTMPFWITPKVQLFDGSRTSVAAGVLHGTLLGQGSMGLAYVTSTTGDAKASFTVGGGVLYAKDSDGDGGGVEPIVQLGGERRLNRRVTFITENYLSRHGGGWLSGGVRLQGQRFSFDLGLSAPFVAGEFIWVFPVLNWAWKF